MIQELLKKLKIFKPKVIVKTEREIVRVDKIDPLEMEDLKLWLENPTTKKFTLFLKKTRLYKADNIMANSKCYDDVNNAIGFCEGIQSIVEIIEESSLSQEKREEIIDAYLYDIFQPLTKDENKL